MKYKILLLLVLFSFGFIQAQELNCTVTVNSSKIGTEVNKQVFKTLERSLTDFVNKTNFTGKEMATNEKINCSMFIDILTATTDAFTSTIQVQSSRTIYNSTYSSPVLNYNDKEFAFNYTEFQNLSFNPTSFDSNLVSVISFYSALIIGMDADTFANNGGSEGLALAQDIASIAQSSGYAGWSPSTGNSNRYFLINDMLSNTFSPYRQAMYQYHFEALDTMATDLKSSKEKIKTAIATLTELQKVRPNAFLTRTFFDAKSDELLSIFSGGPSISITDLVDNLNRVSPTNASKWAGIKF
jgi:Domain of unknown function (DUF4835)